MLDASLLSYYAENSGSTIFNTAKFPALQQKANIYIFQRKKKKEILVNKSIPVFDKIYHKGRQITYYFGTTGNKR